MVASSSGTERSDFFAGTHAVTLAIVREPPVMAVRHQEYRECGTGLGLKTKNRCNMAFSVSRVLIWLVILSHFYNPPSSLPGKPWRPSNPLSSPLEGLPHTILFHAPHLTALHSLLSCQLVSVGSPMRDRVHESGSWRVIFPFLTSILQSPSHGFEILLHYLIPSSRSLSGQNQEGGLAWCASYRA